MRKSKYTYRCPMCGRTTGTNLPYGPSTFPTCNGNEGSHSKLMDFIESESDWIPRHLEEQGIERSVFRDKDSGYKVRDGGNWIE